MTYLIFIAVWCGVLLNSFGQDIMPFTTTRYQTVDVPKGATRQMSLARSTLIVIVPQTVTISWSTNLGVIQLMQSTNLSDWSLVGVTSDSHFTVIITDQYKLYRCVTTSSVTLQWDASTDVTVTGYRIYWGNQSKLYDHSEDAGTNTTLMIDSLRPTNYFAAIAYNSITESDFSNEVSYYPPVASPFIISITRP